MNKHLAESDLATPKVTTGPIAGSRKIYARPEAAPDLKVPLREIALDPSSGEPPVPIYDPSGPYSDPDATIDVERACRALRTAWVRSAAASRSMKAARSSRSTTAMSAASIWRATFPNTPKPLCALLPLASPRRRGGIAAHWRPPACAGSPHPELRRHLPSRGGRSPPHPARMGARRRHHQGNDLHRRARKSRPQDDARRRAGGA